jgi:regulatory protein YycI of two-component signal transduction system YycFG
MDRILLTTLIGLTVTLVLVIVPLINYWLMAQTQNTTAPQNTTLPQKSTKKMIIKDNTVTIVNTTTNETISVRDLTANTGNTTTNESLAANTGNTTTNESLAANTGNTTTNESLAAKFKALQGE